MSGDPEQEYFADGMVEEITTGCQPHPLAVRDRPQLAFTYKGRRSISSRWRANSASATCSKARCARAATGCA